MSDKNNYEEKLKALMESELTAMKEEDKTGDIEYNFIFTSNLANRIVKKMDLNTFSSDFQDNFFQHQLNIVGDFLKEKKMEEASSEINEIGQGIKKGIRSKMQGDRGED